MTQERWSAWTETAKTVPIGEMAVISGEGRLAAYGLGSCVGLALVDRLQSVAGLAHVFLPRGDEDDPRFANKAVPQLLRAMTEAGAKRAFVSAYLAGGASIFSMGEAGKDVGTLNGEILRQELQAAGLPLLGCDLGGSVGRTVVVDVGTGEVLVYSKRKLVHRWGGSS